jgi:hypothetical protein
MSWKDIYMNWKDIILKKEIIYAIIAILIAFSICMIIFFDNEIKKTNNYNTNIVNNLLYKTSGTFTNIVYDPPRATSNNTYVKVTCSITYTDISGISITSSPIEIYQDKWKYVYKKFEENQINIGYLKTDFTKIYVEPSSHYNIDKYDSLNKYDKNVGNDTCVVLFSLSLIFSVIFAVIIYKF